MKPCEVCKLRSHCGGFRVREGRCPEGVAGTAGPRGSETERLIKEEVRRLRRKLP